jgi:hypothetical protein
MGGLGINCRTLVTKTDRNKSERLRWIWGGWRMAVMYQGVDSVEEVKTLKAMKFLTIQISIPYDRTASQISGNIKFVFIFQCIYIFLSMPVSTVFALWSSYIKYFSKCMLYNKKFSVAFTKDLVLYSSFHIQYVYSANIESKCNQKILISQLVVNKQTVAFTIQQFCESFNHSSFTANLQSG